MAGQKSQKIRKFHVYDALSFRLFLIPDRFYCLKGRWFDERSPRRWILCIDGLDHPLLLSVLLGYDRFLYYDITHNLARHVADQVPAAPSIEKRGSRAVAPGRGREHSQ